MRKENSSKRHLRKPAAAFRVRMELPGGWEFRGRHWSPRSRAYASTNTVSGLKLASRHLRDDLRVDGATIARKVTLNALPFTIASVQGICSISGGGGALIPAIFASLGINGRTAVRVAQRLRR